MSFKLYAAITNSEYLVGLVYLLTSHHFGYLRLPYRYFLLITSPNISSFCGRVPYIQCELLSSPYFWQSKMYWVSLPIPSQQKG